MGNRRREYIKENNLKITYTTLFLLPIFGIGGKKNTPSNFISSYLTDNDTNIAIVFDKDNECDVILDLKYNKYYLYDEVYDDEYVIFMKIPPKYEVDVNLFKIGRWSKLSNLLKGQIVETHTRIVGNGKYLTVADAVFPDKQAREYRAEELDIKVEDLPNGEVISVPDMEKERFKNIEELYGVK